MEAFNGCECVFEFFDLDCFLDSARLMGPDSLEMLIEGPGSLADLGP